LEYGESLRTVRSIAIGENEVLATLEDPRRGGLSVSRPALADGALQAAMGSPGRPALPFVVDSVEVLAPCMPAMWAHVRMRGEPGLRRLDADLCDATGAVAMRVRGLVCRTPGGDDEVALFEPVWRAAEPRPEHARRETLRLAPSSRAGDTATRFVENAAELLATLQPLLDSNASRPTLLQLVVPSTAPLESAFGAMLATAAAENPALAAQVIAADDHEGIADKLSECAADAVTPHIRYRDGRRCSFQWREIPDGRRARPWRDGGVYLITGGAGALGRIFAHEIARTVEAPALVLCGRSADAGEVVASLHDAGARASYHSVDVADREAVDRLIGGIVREYGRLDGVLHAAGVSSAGHLLQETEATLRDTLAPKVNGVVNLDEATRDIPLELFVLFGSAAAVLTPPGQGAYALANAFLDAYATQRESLVAMGQRHGRTLSIAWPLWRDGGMQVGDGLEERIYQATGLLPMRTAAGIDAFDRAWSSSAERVLVLYGDGDAVRRMVAGGEPPVAAAAAAAERFNPDAEALITDLIAEALKLPAAKIDPAAPMAAYGINSLMVLDLTATLEKTFGALPTTLFFEYRTLRALAGYFVSRHRPRLEALIGRSSELAAGEPSAVPAAAAPPPRTEQGDIAIIGLAGRYPQADDLDAFWANLEAGRDCIDRLPGDRWDPAEYGDAERPFGGFLSAIDRFDARFFHISPREAGLLDPQERLFLECAWAAFEDAGYTRQRLSPGDDGGAAVGVFVGVMYEEYQLYGAQETLRGNALALSGSASSIANRVSHVFDLTGPSMAVDTMCSSSLTAIHLASASLQRGECRMALAGGVNVSAHPNKYILLRQGKFVSSTGRCRSFGEGGDGYVPAEGVGAVLLKPLRDAEADGDRIYGVIKASAVNHGGRTNGYTVPNPTAQAAVVSRALDAAGVPPRAISYVEAHGTGTSLGDPIEIAALTRAFGDTSRTQRCAIGSVKSNIGHCESAAGVAGLTKVLLQLRHRTLVPSLHSEAVNPNIDFANSPFEVQRNTGHWRRPVIDGEEYPRTAGLSSFGAGGANAHLVIAEYEPPPLQPREDGPALIVLSARDRERLRVQAGRMRDALRDSRGASEGLAAIAYTLQTGRERMEERLAFVAESTADVATKLEAFIAGSPAKLFAGGRGDRDEVAAPFGDTFDATVERWIADRNFTRLAELWALGVPVDFGRLYGSDKPRPVGLPSYPFARDRCWFTAASGSPVPREGATPAITPRESPPALAPAEAFPPAMVFREVLVEERVTAGDAPVGALLCVGADAEQRRDVAAHAPRDTRVTFASGDDVAEHLTAGGCDALLVFVDPRGSLLAPLPVLQALAKARVRPRRVVFAGAFKDPVERSRLASWIGIERSIGMSIAGTEAAVILWPQGPLSMVENLWAEITSERLESAVHEDGRRHVYRVRPAVAQSSRPVLRRGGAYLITGGAGGIGSVLARHLLQAWDARVVLVGRTPEAEIRPRLEAMQGGRGEVTYLQGDVCDAGRMRQVWRAAKESLGTIHGIVHAAGVAGLQTLAAKTPEEWLAVLGPKVAGTLVIDQISAGEALDFICYVSSSSAVLGDFGACDYASGNRFQLAYAEHAPPRAGKRVAVAWPLWRDGGMSSDDEATRLYLESSGQRILESAEGVALLEELLGRDEPHHLVLAGERSRVDGFLRMEQATNGAHPTGPLRERVLADLRRHAGHVLAMRDADLDPDSSLADFGFQSVTLVEFANALSAAFSIDINPALLFAHPTLGKLADHLVAEQRPLVASLYDGAENAPASAAVPIHPTSSRAASQFDPAPDRPGVAIVGMSGRFPMSADVNELWRNLLEGRDCIGEVPPGRWDWRDREGARYGGFIDGVDEFDASFFGISPREARLMDPQQRLLMTHAWKALEDAGIAPAGLAGSNTAVFVGTASTGYDTLLARAGVPLDGYSSTGTVASIGPNRLSYLLDLRGPSEPIETACSSSLVALRRAMAALETGESDLAIAGGVNTILLPDGYVSFDKAGMLSADGRCKTFSDGADGYGRGEGVGMLVLKRLADAERDGDPILAVARGVAEGHGGRANSLTAPNPESQAAMLKSAYASADIDVRTVTYIEAHGTGTPLGDPVEVEGLKSAFARLAPAATSDAWCGIGSVKSNIGHLELAAGIAGVIKVLLQLRHRTLAPTIHCDRTNPLITLEGSPFYIVGEAQPWTAVRDGDGRLLPRRAGVSSFGMGGVNAHVVLEEYVEPEPQQQQPPRQHGPGGPAMVVLSARTPEGLRAQAEALADALERSDGLSLADAAYTLQVGRDAMDERLALVASTPAEAAAKLRACADGEPVAGIHRGAVGQHREVLRVFDGDDLATTIDRWLSDGRHDKLLELWVKGLPVDYERLHRSAQRRRVRLPTYPFARECHWVPEPQAVAAPAPVLHPLLHRNVSDLASVRFRTTLDGSEPFIRDHVVNGRRIVPGVALLEMARAAVALSSAEGALELQDVTWIRPLVVDAPVEVTTSVARRAGNEITFAIEAGEVVCQGSAVLVDPVPERLDIDAALARFAHTESAGSQCYDELRRAGFDYGPSIRSVETVYAGDDGVLANLSSARTSSFTIEPALLDGALHAAAGLLANPDAEVAVPFALEALTILRECSPTMWARVRPRNGAALRTLDVELYDKAGNLCIRMRGLTLRPVDGPDRQSPATRVFRRSWEPPGDVAPASFDHRVVVACGIEVPSADCVTIETSAGDPARSFSDAADRLLGEVRDLHRREGTKLLRLVVPAGDLHAGLAGLLRTAKLELPDFSAQVIEVAEGELDLGAVPDGADSVRVTAGKIAVAAWKELPDLSRAAMPWLPGGVHLIAGGAGALGMLCAEEIARRAGNSAIVLAGRSALDDRLAARLKTLDEHGVRASYEEADLADRASVRSLIERALALHGRLDVVVHAAGVISDAPVLQTTDLAGVLAPKVAGLVHLDEATSELDLHALICFASTAGAHGNPGQAGYAAANAFMDAYAAYRNTLVASGHRRGRTLSIDWPLWENGGMRPSKAAVQRMRRAGATPMATSSGFAALDRAWGSQESQIVVTCRDPRTPRRAAAAGAASRSAAAGAPGRAVDLLAGLLEIDPHRVDLDEPLTRYGFDSIALTQFVNRLQAEIRPSITVSAIAACETARDILAAIDTTGAAQRGAAARFPQLIRMNGVAEGRPVFWIHHGNGGVEVYEPLARRCTRPFYGIQPKGWMTDSPILVGQVAMARYYVSVIRAVQPEGPYDLGGFSFGGLLAYEVVRQLQETGATVATLVMLDTLDGPATVRTNELITAGPPSLGPTSKGSLFRAANLLLGGGNLSAQEIAARVLHRDDVDASLAEEQFLEHLVELAMGKGIDQTPARFRARVAQLARYFSAMEREECAVGPLPDPEGVACYYVRNASGIFFGPHAPYMLLHPPAPDALEAVDRLEYWRQWEELLPRFEMIEVDTASHSELLTAAASLDRILELCDAVYSSSTPIHA
jgi:acyl transferase domain-containing protein/thioesterase domain-containing protein/acyl carrier protein